MKAWSLAASLLSCTLASALAADSQHVFVRPDAAGPKVNVTLFVMSRCPDARTCESVFEDVLQHDGMYDKIHLNMNYIGSLNEAAPLGVECKHGEQECVGNAHQLCLHKHLPLPTFYASLACQNFHTFPGDIGKVAFTKRCLEAVKADWWESGVGKCIEGKRSEKHKAGHLGKEGARLLRENIAGTLATNINTSCTIQIARSEKAEAHQCVVDGGAWRGCDEGHAASDFVRIIEREWEILQGNRDRS